jgi:hypothetical protein
MKFKVEAKGKSETFEGHVHRGNNRARLLGMSPGGQRKLVNFVCWAHGTNNGFGNLSFDLEFEDGGRLGGCRITRGDGDGDIGLTYRSESS